MKKIISLAIAATLLLTPTTASFAKSDAHGKKNDKQYAQQQNLKAHKHVYKIKESPVIKYGQYKLPISPVTKGMGAAVTFDKATATLTVTKGTTTLIINFIAKTVTVNGVAVTNSGLFTAKNDRKMTVLIKYIANVLGVRTNCDDDEVEVEVPGLDLPTNVTVTPVGSTAANTINISTLYITAAANITAGQATGGKAELYVGSRLVATDTSIAAADTSVTFTTSDGTPTNAELQTIVPEGGIVTVRLYNADNKYVTSSVGNPTLVVDYTAPLDLPTNVTVTPVGSTVVANTLNASTLYMTAAANITAGHAAGGKAELYVGSRLVATDTSIAAGDTSVTFTTSDGTPTNAELQATVPEGGIVTVRLYSADNKYVTSAVANPTLVVDYNAPTITGVTSALYIPDANLLYLNVTGAGAVRDAVDVTKISFVDSAASKTYKLTNASGTGSSGVVSSANLLIISIGSADKIGLSGFGTSALKLSLSAGSLLTDTAGNASNDIGPVENVIVGVN